jgi:hypothetical protein
MKVSEINEQSQYNTFALLNHIKEKNIANDVNVHRFYFSTDYKTFIQYARKNNTLIVSKFIVSSSAFPEYFIFTK